LLIRAIADFEYDGADVDAQRSRKEFIEADVPFQRKWGSFFSKKTTITSSQIFHMAFSVGNIESAHAKLITYLLGFLNDDFAYTGTPTDLPQPNDDPRVIELKLFFATCAFAGAKGLPVLVDA
jgi:hypothetical protein